jgi:hypothetical protein
MEMAEIRAKEDILATREEKPVQQIIDLLNPTRETRPNPPQPAENWVGLDLLIIHWVLDIFG